MSLVYEASLTVFCCFVDWGTFSAAIYVAVGALSYTSRLLACLCVSSEWRMFVNGGRISTHWMILWPKQKYVSVCVGYSQQTSDDDYSIENILLALCSPIFEHYSFLSVGLLQDVEENDFTAGGGVGKSSYTQREGEWEHRGLYAFVVSPLMYVCGDSSLLRWEFFMWYLLLLLSALLVS